MVKDRSSKTKRFRQLSNLVRRPYSYLHNPQIFRAQTGTGRAVVHRWCPAWCWSHTSDWDAGIAQTLQLTPMRYTISLPTETIQ